MAKKKPDFVEDRFLVYEKKAIDIGQDNCQVLGVGCTHEEAQAIARKQGGAIYRIDKEGRYYWLETIHEPA